MSGAPFDRILIMDAETRWSKKPTDWCEEPYSISKMTAEEYLRSPLFKCFGFGVKAYGVDEAPIWITHAHLPRWLAGVDWSRTAVVCHNAQFDCSILAWHYGVKPAFIFDTLSMARALRGVEVGNSAAKLADDFGLPPKGEALHSSDGLYELPLHVEQELAEYCKHDVWLCEQFFDRLKQDYPPKELRIIDMTIRMYTEPALEIDAELLEPALEEERVTRESLLARLNVQESMLASNDQFAAVLKALGVEPPTKVSRTVVGKQNYAFAKNDAMFQALLNGPNEDVALLCEARLKVKSTQQRTRAQRFIDISRRGPLPVPLSYFGTLTGRWAAAKGSSINMQNMKRGSVLRRAIQAPKGYVVVVGDLSQIEPRVLAVHSGYTGLLDIFRSGQDAYAQFGARMFGIPGLTKESHPDLRQSAKSALLGAGYRLGWASFAAQLLVGFLGAPPVRYDRAFMKQLGIGKEAVQAFMYGRAGEERITRMLEIARTCTDEELLIHCVCAKAIIDTYRGTAEAVVEHWKFLETALTESIVGGEVIEHCGMTFCAGRIILPNGMPLKYDSIEVEKDEKGRPQYTYQEGKKRKKLHSGILAENTVSGSARIVMSDGMLRVQKRYKPLLTVHDEGGYLVPEEEAEEAKAWIREQMCVPPAWLPNVPLAADVGFHRRYGDAKK